MNFKFSRREIMAGMATLTAIGALGLPGAAPAKASNHKANIVILGAGAAGTAMASRLRARLPNATITIVDARKDHWYQPGFTLIAAGLKSASYSVSDTGNWLPSDVNWVPEAVAMIDPDAKRIETTAGTKLSYDYLVVATGMVLDWDAIEGFSLDQVGSNGIGAVYAGPEYAAKTWAAMDAFTDTGGRAVFTRPATEMKCAGAPLKYTFLTEDYLQRKGTRDRSEVIYAANNKGLFSVPIVNEKVRMLYGERGVEIRYEHVLKAVDSERKTLTFATPEGDKNIDFDFTNIIPPMRAPEVVRNSPLPWADKWTDQGWAEVDPHTMRHGRYADVFAVGDIAGVPKGKTAASVKWQVPVAEDHLVAQIDGRDGTERYDGYTSCPLITKVGRAMLVEFDYKNNLVPSFPGVIAPLEELWVSWLMKEIALKATYNAMLRGKA